MKAEELMIGDWGNIYVFPNENPKDKDLFPAKITAILTPTASESSGDTIECMFTALDGTGGVGYASRPPETFLPIPLTAEILEKNGLRKVTLNGEKGSKQDYYIDTHIVGYYNMDALTRVHASPIVYDIKQKWLFVDDKSLCRIELMCPYVHTLQHALRLCGIDKKIVL